VRSKLRPSKGLADGGATLEEAFRAWQDIAEAGVAGDGKAQGAGEAFEEGFDLVMRGAAVEAPEVYVGFGGLCEALEKIFQEFGLEVAYAWGIYFCFDDAVGAAAQIDGGGREGFVHGH
jgi:hypothetical protein